MKITPVVSALVAACIAQVSAGETNRPNFDLVRQLNEAFIQVAETASPSVVVLTITQKQTVFARPDAKEGPEMQEYWERFHRQFNDEPSIGGGSGIIIRKDGYIMTNRHVVEDAEKIEVRLLDGRKFTATVRGVDAQSDVAVIKIEADNLPVARLGDSAKVRVGEFAIAIGAPFSLDYSVTFGHISAKGRTQVVPMLLGGRNMDQDFLQTDANINMGNSGGPLINIDGEVIGVNTLIRGTGTGIGFAIPINLARQIADQLITNGRFVRPWLGIEIMALSEKPELFTNSTSPKAGVVIQGIVPEGPSGKSELRADDIIVSVDGRPVATPQQLRTEIRGKAIGQPITLEVMRAGAPVKMQISPGEYVQAASMPADEKPAKAP